MQANLFNSMDNLIATSNGSITKEYHGEPVQYDPEFKGAKIERRSTDFKCLILFIVCFIVWILIAIYALIQGDLTVHFHKFDAQSEDSDNITSDLKKTWPVMFFGIGFGIVACLIVVAVMRWIAAFVTWVSIFLSIVLLGIAAAYNILMYSQYQGSEQGMFYLSSGIFAAICFVIIIISVFIFRRKIKLSIELIKEASKATSANIFIMFFPILQSFLEVLVILFAIYVFLKLRTIGEHSYHADCRGEKCDLVTVSNPILIHIFMYYTIFETLWTLFFITAIGEMVLAGIFVAWYWTFNKDSVSFDTFSESFYRTFRYHLGTLAFGSLIITIIRVVSILVSSAEEYLRDSNNVAARCVFCCFECLVQAIENFMKMINKNAYILTAVHGTDFVTSAKNAFNLIMRNLLGVIVLNNVTDSVLFMMQLLVSFGTTACFYTAITVIYSGLHAPGILAAIYFIIIFFITVMFFSVFSMAVDTIFLCFLEDLERNNGSAERPYYMLPKLREILQKEN